MYTYHVSADAFPQPRAFAQPHEAVAAARATVDGPCQVAGMAGQLHRSRRSAFDAEHDAAVAATLTPASQRFESNYICALLFFAVAANDSNSSATLWREVFEAAD